MSQTFKVDGLTCGHCAWAVDNELRQVAGVSNVEVKLNTAGTTLVLVDADHALTDDEVKAALEEAGDNYTLVGD